MLSFSETFQKTANRHTYIIKTHHLLTVRNCCLQLYGHFTVYMLDRRFYGKFNDLCSNLRDSIYYINLLKKFRNAQPIIIIRKD